MPLWTKKVSMPLAALPGVKPNSHTYPASQSSDVLLWSCLCHMPCPCSAIFIADVIACRLPLSGPGSPPKLYSWVCSPTATLWNLKYPGIHDVHIPGVSKTEDTPFSPRQDWQIGRERADQKHKIYFFILLGRKQGAAIMSNSSTELRSALKQSF